MFIKVLTTRSRSVESKETGSVTASLDSVTEKEIQDALHSVMIDKTVIVIAHRLSTIMLMDRILFFDGGKIIEDGSVAELEAKNGCFAKLLAMQREEH